MKKSSFFYNESQIAEMKQAIENKEVYAVFARNHAEEWERSEGSITNKMWQISKGLQSEGKQTSSYSEDEVKLLKHAIFRGDKLPDIVTRYAEKWNRGRQGLYAKLWALKKEMQITNPQQPLVTVKKEIMAMKENLLEPVKEQEPEVGTTLPKGFKFEGNSKKVVLYSDHFRVYF